jgi:predicted peptidase
MVFAAKCYVPLAKLSNVTMRHMKLLSTAALLLAVALPLPAKVFDKTAEISGIRVQYKFVLPKDYDPEKTYPAILAFPPGSQTMDMVLTTLQQHWATEADRRGYIVVVPAVPLLGQSFAGEAAKIFPEFIEKLLHDYKVRDMKFHVAGMSNGGRSAFHIAASYPQYFRSVIGLPGYLPNPTPERVAALAKLCLYMHVGEFDTDWVEQMQQQVSMFRSKGYSVQSTIEKGQGHVMRTLAFENAARLFKEMEECPK